MQLRFHREAHRRSPAPVLEHLSHTAKVRYLHLANCVFYDVIDAAGGLRAEPVTAARRLLQPDGSLARVAIEHRDPVRRALALRLQEEFPPRADAPSGPANVTRTGTMEFETHVPDAVLRDIAPEPERLRILSGLGVNSYISAPLATRGRILGSITLFTEAGRLFEPDDAMMAEDLARRAATAIDNARLYEEAQRAVRSRDDMLAIVTHDLRTPLSAIVTAAALQIAETPDDEDGVRTRQRAESIQRSAQHLSRLIRDLTELGQIDAGRFAIERAAQDPPMLVRDVVEALEPIAARHESSLQMQILGAVPAISCDGDRIVQVLSNLVSNAIKVRARSITVSVEAQHKAVLFTVSDTGPGIAGDDLPHMFDRYWRAKATNYKGTGLGLPISKGIVDAHGGRIWAESEIGVGSRFYVTLPY
jgi:signal transduction histidine kinase